MPRVFRHRLRVRYGECDPQGIVFNANYLAYFDVILTEFWREAIGDYNAMIDEHGADMVVAESRIRYLKALRVARLGNTALGTLIDASVDERPVVAGEMRHVFIDPATKVKRPMPVYHLAAKDSAALLAYFNARPTGKMREQVNGADYRNLAHAKAEIGAFIEHVYNRQRLHSALAYRSPDEYEEHGEGLLRSSPSP